MDTETRHCCAHWNENSASSTKQLHGTTFGWIHGCALWLGDVAATQIVQRVSAFSWVSVFNLVRSRKSISLRLLWGDGEERCG